MTNFGNARPQWLAIGKTEKIGEQQGWKDYSKMKNPSTKTKIRKARKKMAKHPSSQTPEEIAAARKESEEYNANLQSSINYRHTIEDNFSKDMLLDDKLSSEILYNACMKIAAKLAFNGKRGVPWFIPFET